jgi:hypothetical protein
MALNLVVRYGGSSQQSSKRNTRQDIPRHELWTLADATLSALPGGTGLPYARELRTLHEERNLAQHAGTAPSTETIQRAVAPVREFLSVVFQKLFAQDFNRFRMWHLVACLPLRALFEDIDEAFRLSLTKVAMAGCIQAHQLIVAALTSVAEGFVALNARARFEEERRDREIRQTHEALASAVNSMRAMLIISGVGIGMEETLRFDRCSSGLTVHPSVGGHLWVADRTTEDPERLAENAEFMFDYVVRVALFLEDSYPGIFARVDVPVRLRAQRIWEDASPGAADPDTDGPLPTPPVGT